MECVFCTQHDIAERVITENAHAHAFPTNIPITPGHTLIVPKRHVQTISELTELERNDVFDLAETIKGALRKGFGAQGFNHAWNESEIAGQSVPHFHLHIVPRTPGDTGVLQYEPRDFLYRPGSRAATPQQELIDVAMLIRAALTA
jgi:diadenosine tetraphosphate (Ap4A) HIT family hydrolase